MCNYTNFTIEATLQKEIADKTMRLEKRVTENQEVMHQIVKILPIELTIDLNFAN